MKWLFGVRISKSGPSLFVLKSIERLVLDSPTPLRSDTARRYAFPHRPARTPPPRRPAHLPAALRSSHPLARAQPALPSFPRSASAKARAPTSPGLPSHARAQALAKHSYPYLTSFARSRQLPPAHTALRPHRPTRAISIAPAPSPPRSLSPHSYLPRASHSPRSLLLPSACQLIAPASSIAPTQPYSLRLLPSACQPQPYSYLPRASHSPRSLHRAHTRSLPSAPSHTRVPPWLHSHTT